MPFKRALRCEFLLTSFRLGSDFEVVYYSMCLIITSEIHEHKGVYCLLRIDMEECASPSGMKMFSEPNFDIQFYDGVLYIIVNGLMPPLLTCKRWSLRSCS